jgi:hypothetical protein
MKLPGILFLTVLFIGVKLPAQFMIGWNGGYANPRELNREIYIYDAINGPNLTKKMQPVHWNQGPLIGMRIGNEGFVEFTYTRKKAAVSSEFDSSSVPMIRQMKVFCNTFNLGFGYTSNNWTIGGSFDFGRFKAFGRRGTVEGIKDQDWQRLWVLNKTRILLIAVDRAYITESVFVERAFGIVSVRAYVQFGGMKKRMDGLDPWLFGTELNYADPNEERFPNYGLSVFFKLGKK